MRIKTVLALALIVEFFLAGCATHIEYKASSEMPFKEASALVADLTMSQDASGDKPSHIEVHDKNIFWENDLIVFNTITYAELLKKSDKYLVQINFKGDVFRKSDWLVVYRTTQIEDAKRYINALSSLIVSRSGISNNADSAETNKASTNPGKVAALPGVLVAPLSITGNGGKFMSPFTVSGDVALWAQKPAAVKDGGSNLAVAAGGAAGQYAADKALEFVPFGLGGLLGRKVGESTALAATQKNIEQEMPSIETVIATSDISFNTLDELAVYMYVKNSSHGEYARVLALTTKVYPELQGVYAVAIEKASQLATEKASQVVEQQKVKSTQERLKELSQLKKDGLISDAEFKAKKGEILKSL